MIKKSSLNNRRLRSIRKSEVYEAVLTDLYLIGALQQDVVETLTGKKISSHLVNPLDGQKPSEVIDDDEEPPVV